MPRVARSSILLATALSIGCTSPTTSAANHHHYVDEHGAALPQYDFVWDRLFAYFGSATPDPIRIEHSDGATSQFSPKDEAIILNHGNDKVEVVAHESTHLCNDNLTQGVSNTNAFRFVDEGFAEIMGYGIANEADWYKTYALAIAEQENQKGDVSIDRVQDWSTYFGASTSDPSTRNWRAYQVGSSFEYMIQDTRGAAALRTFLVDIGVTRDLRASIQNVFLSTSSTIEDEWIQYLNRVQIDTSVPAVVALSPANDSNAVPLDTSEIAVTFSVAMGKSVCIVTPCADTGVCYSNAYWKAHNVLAIKVDGHLKAGGVYQMTLGNQASGCRLASYVGTAMPVTSWQFTAATQ